MIGPDRVASGWRWCSGAGRGQNIVNVERLGALAAHDNGVHVMVAGGVMQHNRRALGP